MQKLINVLALASFAVSGAVVGAGAYVYLNREAITDNIKSQIMEGVASAISEQMGDLGNLGGGGLPAEGPGAGEVNIMPIDGF